MATKAIVGQKVGMTQVWDDQNRIVPVTVLQVEPLRVVSIRTPERDGYSALQVTFGHKKATKLTRPGAGQYSKAGVDPGERLVELRLDDVSGYTVGQEINVAELVDGDLVDVTAVSKGKGFAGVMKRHGFAGQKASHGTHRVHRMPGSVGACATPARVFKGTLTGAVPTVLNDLLHNGADTDMSSLRLVMCGGAAVPRALIDGYRETFGLPVVQGWGMTETSPVCAIGTPPKEMGDLSETDWRVKTGRASVPRSPARLPQAWKLSPPWTPTSLPTMSWMSPLTVPMTTVPWRWTSLASVSSGRRISIAPFIALAAIDRKSVV